MGDNYFYNSINTIYLKTCYEALTYEVLSEHIAKNISQESDELQLLIWIASNQLYQMMHSDISKTTTRELIEDLLKDYLYANMEEIKTVFENKIKLTNYDDELRNALLDRNNEEFQLLKFYQSQRKQRIEIHDKQKEETEAIYKSLAEEKA